MRTPQEGIVVSDPQIVPLFYQGRSMGLRIGVIVRLLNGQHVPAILDPGFFPSRGIKVMTHLGEEQNLYFAERV